MTDFHFIRPLWLIAMLALIIAMVLLKRIRISQSGWHRFLPDHLATVLVGNENQHKPASLWLPFFIGTITIVALAGPTWQKLPQPVFQVDRGSVLIMDMSYSMYATDLTPNRLTRARYKAVDLLDGLNEGDVGLIAYAGDAFVISPLTEDINNIKLLLPSLSPDIMPELGSNPIAALIMANEMLTNAGHVIGDIYWFTDGIDNDDIQAITQWSRNHRHSLNILGTGTRNGAPIKLTSGELMKDSSGAIIIPKLTEHELNTLASRGKGSYRTITNDSTDVNALITDHIEQQGQKQQDNLKLGDQWQEAGPYLLLLLLPLLLGYFRRGNLLAALPLGLLLSLLLSHPTDVHASLWQDLWQSQDQQAQQAFDQQHYAQAAEKFNEPLWQGSAHYRAGNFEQALQSFAQDDSADGLYNQGNALAKLHQLDKAISAYEKALAKNPALTPAAENKALLEQLKKQQQEQQKDQQDSSGEQDKNQQEQDKSAQQQEQSGQQNQQQNQSGQQDQQQDQSDQQAQDGQQNAEQNAGENQQAKSAQNEAAEQHRQNADQPAQENQTQEEQAKEKQNTEQRDQQQSPAEQAQSPAQDSSEQSAATKQAQLEQSQQDQETQQKLQQLLNKVTDDPYLLLRNKMQLEYQKRRQNGSPAGEQKKW